MSIKTIFITGSGSGIGKASALALADKGHRVIATTHYKKEAQELNRIAVEKNLTLEAFVLDITNAKDRAKILTYDIDVLINNAGMGETGSLAEIDIDKVRNNFEVNVFSTLELTQLALRSMLKKNSGTIIIISSLLGRVTSPFFGPYSMTKFALSSGAEMLSSELSLITDSVHIAVVEPGAYHTGFNQKMTAKKFEWMNHDSYFYSIIDQIRKMEARNFKWTEQKDTTSIVKKIIEVTEANHPRFRSSAPWWQALGTRILLLKRLI